MKPIDAFKKSNENEVYVNIKEKRDRQKPKVESGQPVRTADVKRVFSKGASTIYSYKLYTNTEVIHDTIPSYRINYPPER